MAAAHWRCRALAEQRAPDTPVEPLEPGAFAAVAASALALVLCANGAFGAPAIALPLMAIAVAAYHAALLEHVARKRILRSPTACAPSRDEALGALGDLVCTLHIRALLRPFGHLLSTLRT